MGTGRRGRVRRILRLLLVGIWGLLPALPAPKMPPPVLARAAPDRPRDPLPQIDRPVPATPASLGGDRHPAGGAPYRVFLPLVRQAGDPDRISPYGGVFTSPDGRVTVEVPPGAVTSSVRLRYAVRSPAPPDAGLALAFDLEATDQEGRAVRAFRAPLALTVRLPEALPASSGVVLSVYDPGQGRWVPLPSLFDRVHRVLRAWTSHFSTFGVQVQEGEGAACRFRLLEAVPPGETGSGTAPEVPDPGPEGGARLVSPSAYGKGTLTLRRASDARSRSWVFPGGAFSEDVADLFPRPSGPITNPYALRYTAQLEVDNTAILTHTSGPFDLELVDRLPPRIRGVQIFQDGEGGVAISADIEDNCALAAVVFVAASDSGGGGVAAPVASGNGRYGAVFTLPRVGRNTFTIWAADATGNVAVWSAALPAAYSGAFGFAALKGPCGGTCGTEGDPVNTASGNFVTRTLDLRLPGIGNTEIRVERTYNAQAVPPQGDFALIGMDPGPFGPGWSWPFDFRLEFMENDLLRGIKVHYPDGHTARFRREEGGAFTPLTPGNTDRLQAVPGGYVLQQKDLTRYRFDPEGRLVEVRDANGNTQTLTYDGAGRLVRVENSAGRWIEIAYTPEGRIAEIRAPGGVRLRYAYTDGLLTAFTDARGQTWQYAYDAAGRLTEIRAPKGHPALRMRYDDQGRVIELIEGATARRTFAYDNPAHLRRVADAYGRVTVHQYDARYRLIRLTDPLGETEEYGYDDQDRRVFFKDKEGRRWRYVYDDRGNLIHEDGPLGWERAWEYNEMDRLTMEQDPAGRRTLYTYDDRGNLTVITNALGFTRTFAYDDRGLPIRLTDFNGNVITNSYDAAGNLIAVENGVGAVTRYGYDGLGRTVAMTTPNGAVFTYTYDAGSPLLTGIFGPLGYRETYEYDPNGNLSQKVDPNGNPTRYEYDNSDRLVAEVNALGYTTVYTYGLMNELVAMQDAEGRVTTYEYDALLRLIAVHAPEGATTRYAYDGVGNLTDETDPEGRVTHYIYNDLDRLVERIQNYVPGGPQNADTNVSTHYEYDPAGNLIQVVDPNGIVTRYEYDVLNRLRAEIRNFRPGEPPGPDVHVTTHYEYDPNGNLIRRVNPRGFATVYAYDAANRLIAVTDALSQTTTYAYDPDGNLLALTDPAGMTIRYEYDLLDRRTAEIRNFRPDLPSGPDVNVTTRYEYDPAGNLVRVVNPNGIPTCYEYDALNRLITEIRNCQPGQPPGPDVNVATHYEYDRVGNLILLTDPNGHSTHFVYDGLNRLVSRTDPGGHTVTFSYDRVGNLIRQVDARGFPTAYAYDALNRPITVTNALSGTVVFRYDSAGNLLARTDPNNHTTHFTYDGLYRLATVTDPEGFVTRYEYDPNGNRTALVDGNGHRTTLTYDPLDRLETVTNAEGETTRYSYDPVGNQTQRIEPDGVVTRYDYDGVYRLAAVTLNHRPGAPADHQTNVTYRYHYDPVGNRLQVDLPPNAAAFTRTLRYEYDPLNRLMAETDPLGNTWRYGYDPAGNRIRRVDPEGHVTTYTYDADNLLVRIAYDDGTAIAFAYDENHNRTVMTDTLGVSRWVYDPLNRVVEVTDSLGRRLGYGYDPASNWVALTLPEGGVIRYHYSANNRLRGVTDPEGRRTLFERDGEGNLRRQFNPNGTVTEASYDRANRLRSLTTRRLDGTVIAAFAYELNEVGLRTVMTATYGWRNPPVVTERYTYDPLRRLVGVSDSEGFQAIYEYDAAGNRTRWWANDDQTTPRPRDGFEVTSTYDAADQLLQALRVGSQPNDRQAFVYAYDANGNRVNLNWPGPPGPNTQGMDYVYDRENRLIAVQAYQVNHRGQRVEREVTRLYYDGLGRRLVKEYDPKAGAGGVKRTEYAFDHLNPVAEYFLWNGQRAEYYRGGAEAFSPTPMLLALRHFPAGTQGQTYWVHLDGRGSVAGLTKHQGQSTHNYRYDAYGLLLPAQGNWTDPHNHYTFAGKEWDEHLGLYEFGVRLYDPWAGVWLTREPLPAQAGEPRTWHRYGYAWADPVNRWDPYGEQIGGFGGCGTLALLG